MTKFTLFIPEMMCAHCEKHIRDAVEAIGGTVESIDIEPRKAVLHADISEAELLKIIDDAGYEAKIIR
jgi:Cu+-exporting ATPase